VTNGELVLKSIGADGAVKLADGRVLDASYEFLPPMLHVTVRKLIVDYVLFSDARSVRDQRPAMATISRGRRGIRIFTG
jgi:hypothetical protein